MKKTKVIIAGGGFAGLSAAMYLDKTLARREDIEVTLISRENFILFTPMLHEVAAGDLHVYNTGTTGDHRTPHGGRDGIRDEISRLHRVVLVADRLSHETAAPFEKVAGDGRPDSRPSLFQRHRTNDHLARR